MYTEEKFDSLTQHDYVDIPAPYYNAIKPTKINFVNEHMIATINSLGHIEFFDMGNNSLAFVDFPVSKDPSKYGHTAQYGNAKYMAKDGMITFQLPVYGWEDSYPHCDGESDRWSREILRWFSIHFDCNTKEIKVIK